MSFDPGRRWLATPMMILAGALACFALAACGSSKSSSSTTSSTATNTTPTTTTSTRTSSRSTPIHTTTTHTTTTSTTTTSGGLPNPNDCSPDGYAGCSLHRLGAHCGRVNRACPPPNTGGNTSST